MTKINVSTAALIAKSTKEREESFRQCSDKINVLLDRHRKDCGALLAKACKQDEHKFDENSFARQLMADSISSMLKDGLCRMDSLSGKYGLHGI